MKKCFIYLILVSFFYTSNLNFFGSYLNLFTLNSSIALTITKEKKEELVQTCLAESPGVSYEECIVDMETRLAEVNKEVVAVNDSIHGTTTSEDWAMFIGVLLNIASYIMTMSTSWAYFWPKPSFWLGVGASLVLFFWYFGALVVFSDYANQIETATNQKLKSIGDMTIEKGTNETLAMGIELQRDALRKARNAIPNFKNALKTASIMSYAGAAFAIIECCFCWLIPKWCVVPKKDKTNPIYNFLKVIFPTQAKAEFQDETLNEAKEESGADGVGFDISAWTQNIVSIVKIVFQGLPYEGAAIAFAMEKINRSTAEKQASAILCGIRAGLLTWDGSNYLTIMHSWEDARSEINNRIVVLNKTLKIMKDSIPEGMATNDNPTSSINNSLNGNASTAGFTLAVGDGRLKGICFDSNIQTGDSSVKTKDSECEDNDFAIPKNALEKTRDQIGTFLPEAADFADDVIADVESIENGINTKGSVNVSDDSLKKAKAIIPKLLRLKRQIEKDRNLPPSKSLIDNFFEAAKIRTKQQNAFAKLLQDKGISLKGSLSSLSKSSGKKNKDAKSSSSKKSVQDDTTLGSLKPYKLGDMKLKRKRGKKSSAEKLRSDALEKYSIKHDDIVKKKGASIWKVLNNRYLQSGYPRLFKER